MTQQLDTYRREYAKAQPPRLPGWLQQVRDAALAEFLSRGFPTTRDEEWRFTSVTPIAELGFALDGQASAESAREVVERHRLPMPAGAEIVFVNGRFAPSLSRAATLPRGVRVESLASALENGAGVLQPHLTRRVELGRSAFSALNTAFLADGAFIQVPAGTVVAEPLHVLFVTVAAPGTTPVMSHPRVVVLMGENSQASLVETYAGADARYFTNALTDVVVGENAVLDHAKLQHESVEAYHVAAMHVTAGRSATVRSHSISFGGALVRNDAAAVLDGDGAHCTLNGLYLADGQRLVDNHTAIDHAKPHCDSREIYKGILGGRARGVFNGKIIVRPDAQKTDAKQTNRALLLSEEARINTKPQLEIFANDVKCTHGAAVGQMDDEAVFYLRSRGLSQAEARGLLIRAFAGDVLQRMPLEPIRTRLEAELLRQLARAA